MDTQQSFGRWVKQRRKALDLTQHELAQRLSCALSTIQKIEIDERKPSRQMAELLAHHLDLAPEERDAFLHLARHQLTLAPPSLTVAFPTRVPLHNLPHSLTSFVGREWEMATLGTRLLDADIRLLTITGPPGIGKTRIALQIAAALSEHFSDGVCFVALASISEAHFVIVAVAQALGINDTSGQSLLARVKEYLRERHFLLLLDNFEHLLPASPVVVELLEAAANLKILVTSRATLQVYGEHEFVMMPLDLPDLKQLPASNQLTHYGSVELFVQRARAVQPEFMLDETSASAVATICVRLEGLPLALELAAARIKLFAPRTLLARLGGDLPLPLDLLTGSHHLPARHRSLRSAIAWSYDLLNPLEKAVFRALGVFAGGCTLAAIGSVMAEMELPPSLPEDWLLQTVHSLVNQSLVLQRQTADDEPRFSMLELLREYALDQLAACDEEETAHRAHVHYFERLADAMVAASAEQRSELPLRGLEVELDNMRAALHWSAENDADLELQLLILMRHFWMSFSRYLGEGRHWLEAALPRIKPEVTPVYVDILHTLGFIAWQQGDFVSAQRRLEGAVAFSRQLQDRRRLGSALQFLALTSYSQGDYAAALPPAEECVAIFRQVGEPEALAQVLSLLGDVMCGNSDYASARRQLEECLIIYRQLNNRWGISLGLLSLGQVPFAEGDDASARVYLETALQNYRELDALWFMGQTLLCLGKVLWRQGDKAQAIALWEESVQVSREVGAKEYLSGALLTLGWAAQERGDPQQAKGLFTQSIALYQEMEHKTGVAYALSELAGLLEPLEQVTKVLAATATVLDTARMPMDQIARARYESALASVRAQLNQSNFAAAWAEGKMMPLDQAVAYALALT